MSSGTLTRSNSISRARSFSSRSLAALLLPLVAIAGVGAANGGFFPTSFGWTALAFAFAVVLAVSLVAPRWRLLDVIWLSAAGAVCLFTFLSAAWAGSVGTAIDEGLRALVYLTGVAGALVVLRRRDIGWWLTGLVLGVAGVCVYSLATRLAPDHFSGFSSADYRLFAPLGYWNALGIFAGMALLLSLGVATLGRGIVMRVLTAAAAVGLAPTLYFTFSRGAWFALVAGTVAALALSPARLRLVAGLAVLGAIPTLAVLLASRASGLTLRGSTLEEATHDGRRLALELVVLVVVQAGVAAVYAGFLSRVVVPRLVSRVFAAVLAVFAVLLLAGVFERYGSPARIARDAYDSFVSRPAHEADLNTRLFTASSNGRIVFWHGAWHEFTAHPAIGFGAGSFDRWWLAHRTTNEFWGDALNVYLETLAELGIVGLALLAVLLGVPLVAALRARKNPLVAPAAGAYVAYLTHATVDWDWRTPAVTLLALFIGAALVTAARRGKPPPSPMRLPGRIALGVGAVVAAAIAFVGLIGSIALARSQAAIFDGDGRTAVAEAARAHTWAPWSAQALVALGQGRILAGSRGSGLEALRQAAADDPGDWGTWFDIAAVTTGAEHRAALARAEALNPLSPEIADVLAAGG